LLSNALPLQADHSPCTIGAIRSWEAFGVTLVRPAAAWNTTPEPTALTKIWALHGAFTESHGALLVHPVGLTRKPDWVYLLLLWSVPKALSSVVLQKVDDSFPGALTPRLVAVHAVHGLTHYVGAALGEVEVALSADFVVIVHHVEDVSYLMSNGESGGKTVIFYDSATSTCQTHRSNFSHT